MSSAVSAVVATARPQTAVKTLQLLWRLRLVSGFCIMLAGITFTIGSAWDIKWHGMVGRDRTFTSSHDMILSGIALAGLTALIIVLVETSWARHNAVVRARSTSFAGAFHGPFGAYVAGFGALSAAVAFPLDNYWHSLHGLDVSLWAPFHLMIFGGSLILTLGGVFLLLSAAYLARKQAAPLAATLGFLGAAIALGNFTSLMMGMADPAYGLLLHIASVHISLYSIMFSVLAMLGCIAAITTIPWRWAATSVALAFIGTLEIAEYFVPAGMAYAVQVEHFSLLPNTPMTKAAHIITQPLPALLVLIALVMDLVAWYGRKKKWSGATLTRALMLVALPFFLLSTGIGFFSPLVISAFPYLHLSGHVAVSGGITTLLVSLCLVLPVALLGVWLGRGMGRAFQGVQA